MGSAPATAGFFGHSAGTTNASGVFGKTALVATMPCAVMFDIGTLARLRAPVKPYDRIVSLVLEFDRASARRDEPEASRVIVCIRDMLRSLHDDKSIRMVRRHSYSLLFDALIFTPMPSLSPSMTSEFSRLFRLAISHGDDVTTRTAVRRDLQRAGFNWLPPEFK